MTHIQSLHRSAAAATLLAALPWALLLSPGPSLVAAEIHVSEKGSDQADGSAATPLRTISAAARRAQPGDTITVHAGVYRERVDPPRGGESNERRIVYQAAPGETPVIKGSEVIRSWQPHQGTTWKASIPNSLFGSYNPYKDLIEGDWFTDLGRPHHTGEVYLNGKALFEAARLQDVLDAQPFRDAREREASRAKWFAQAGEKETVIYANFLGKDPNRELVEINVRESCFYPSRPGRDFITIRGFRMSHAATQWAAPTAEQIALLGTHWSKGWLIENNVVSDAKCSCITLGKERATGHNVWTRNPIKDGATHYNEVILRALEAGWDRGRIGSHIVRGNTIFDCDQAGIAGSLGAIYSEITNNHIYRVWAKRQFTGAEMAGIKLHGAIDVLIARNRVHESGRGLWMDWMAQGTRITGNLLYDNTTDDLFVEVNHGPFLVDNNIFLSPLNLRDWSEGGAYVHNLFAGRIDSRTELNRWTPYHRAHSTALAGVTLTHGGDNRFYNNLFLPPPESSPTAEKPNKSQVLISGFGPWVYDTRKFPSFAGGNVYANTARAYKGEKEPFRLPAPIAQPTVTETPNGQVILNIPPLAAALKAQTATVTTALLGKTIIAELGYDNPDGSALTVTTDFFGKPRKSGPPAPGPFSETPSAATLRVW